MAKITQQQIDRLEYDLKWAQENLQLAKTRLVEAVVGKEMAERNVTKITRELIEATNSFVRQSQR